mmetsp:Transcript_26854/g.65184  ORF Transcript_26854/g.65184 Transcript_26854/m.65184 type:complete len:101 (+) Transcript_26854:2904-3206(+)
MQCSRSSSPKRVPTIKRESDDGSRNHKDEKQEPGGLGHRNDVFHSIPVVSFGGFHTTVVIPECTRTMNIIVYDDNDIQPESEEGEEEQCPLDPKESVKTA